MIDDILNEVSLLPYDKEVEHVMKHLNKVKELDLENEKKLKKAIHECLKALEYAGEGDYTDIRHELINLLRSIEGSWYFSAK